MVSTSAEAYVACSGSSDSIRFDTVVGGLNTIPEFLFSALGQIRKYGFWAVAISTPPEKSATLVGAADSALDMVARAQDAWLVHCISFRISDSEEAIWFYLEERKNLKQKYQSSWHIAHDSTRHGLGIFAGPTVT